MSKLVLQKVEKTEIVYIYEGNNRMTALLDINVDWELLMVNHFILTLPEQRPNTVQKKLRIDFFCFEDLFCDILLFTEIVALV